MFRRIRRVRRVTLVRAAVVLVLLDVFCYRVLFIPGPLLLSALGTYNGFQALRASMPGPTAIWRRHKAKGPPPDPRVVAASNAFGMRLLTDLCDAQPGSNVFFSPYGISSALLMTAGGTGGATQREMVQCLGLTGVDLSAANHAYKRMGDLLACTDPRIEVRAADAVWADDEAGVRSDYVARMRGEMGAEVEVADLQSSDASRRISAWIARHAGKGMVSALPAPQPDDRLYLMSALVFHGEWTSKFKASDTHQGPFWMDDGTEKRIPMMSGKVDGEFTPMGAFSGPYEAARLPFGDGSMSMLIVIPGREHGTHRRSSLSGLLGQMTPAKWAEWTSGLHHQERHVVLPRFQIESQPQVKDALQRMGIQAAFGHRADFRPMCDDPRGVYVDDVVHRARLEVDEEGARAEALTIVIVKSRGGSLPFVVDGPFLCAIRDDRTGLILFMGAIYDPQPF